MYMKEKVIWLLLLLTLLLPLATLKAQGPVALIIKEGVKKVIQAGGPKNPASAKPDHLASERAEDDRKRHE
jgi:hypothetical protein